MQEAVFESADGLSIFYCAWRPHGPPRAIIVVNHGVNSHGGQHAWTAEQFAAHGIAAYAIDMRGRGRSGGKRLALGDVSEHTGDLHRLIGIAKAADPGVPLFLLGHSAGGVVGSSYVLDHQEELAGFICESFAYRVPAPGAVLWLVKNVLGPLFPALPVLKLKMEDFSRDPAAVAALLADPLTRNEAQPAGTVAALLRATDRMRADFPTITIPLLILHGTNDKATMYQGSQEFFDKAGAADKTLKLYRDHYHDLLNDIGKEEVFADILAWIDTRLQ
jgi:alpha-beta hydrolase superfamily lysophospholipase